MGEPGHDGGCRDDDCQTPNTEQRREPNGGEPRWVHGGGREGKSQHTRGRNAATAENDLAKADMREQIAVALGECYTLGEGKKCHDDRGDEIRRRDR